MTIFSGHSVISRVYTSRFGNGTARWNLDRSGTKKVSGTRYSTQWKTPQKWTVPCRTMQWKSANCKRLLMLLLCVGLWPFLNSSIWWQASGFEWECVCEGLLSPSLLSRTTEEHCKLSFHTANKRQSLHLAHTKPHTHTHTHWLNNPGFAPYMKITLLLMPGLIRI